MNHTTDTIGTINPIRYRSYYYDQETGYYYLNSRYYDSNVGRFISADSIGNLGANEDYNSLNLYAYCGNNPINRIDESGTIYNIIGRALFNLGTSYLFAMATNQDFTISDGIIALMSGAVSSLKTYGNILTAMIQFAYTLESSLNIGASIYEALFMAVMSGGFALFDVSKYVDFGDEGKVALKILEEIIGATTTIFETAISGGVNSYYNNKSNNMKNENKSSNNYLANRKIAAEQNFKKSFEVRFGF